MSLPTSARAVIVGGGVSGCSVAYHLAEIGWQDVVLLERKKLTSGTTWHAAGLIGQLRPSANLTRLARYSAELYGRLEAETGVATGLSRRGSITVALTEARAEELRRQAGLARAFGVEVAEITVEETRALYPHLEVSDVTAAVHLPGDGQADPANIALALAKGARQRGAQLAEGVAVTAIRTDRGRVTGVDWTAEDGTTGHIATSHVVNCAGMWARDLGALAGCPVPLHAAEHFYIVTAPIEGLSRLPVLRVPDECAYYKEDAGKLMLGAFEPVAKPWPPAGETIPESFCFDQLPEDVDHFGPILEQGCARVPLLAEAGIHTFFNGPESFTPDNRYYLGPHPGAEGMWVAAGYNSIGIVSSGGAGYALARWMEAGHAPFDLADVDIRRAHAFQANRRYLRARVSESLGLLYADHFPHRQAVTARGVRRSPLHEALKARGAVFGEVAGWERANWFAEPGQAAEYDYSWGRPTWFANATAEHRAVREGAALFDLSSFGKIRVEGRDACAVLQRICAAEMDVAEGRIVYTQFLNARGGIEADVTVTRLSETAYLVVTPAASLPRDLAWIRAHLPGDAHAVATDVTSGEAVIAVMGPRARAVLAGVIPQSLATADFPFGTAREVEIGLGIGRAHRVSYVGELGWELYLPSDQAGQAFEAIEAAGAAHGLRLAGLHTLDSCRMEKAFRHWGDDITEEDHVLEAGLGFAVTLDKRASRFGDFIGREAVLARRQAGLTRRLVQFRLEEAGPQLYRNEPILRDGRPVGHITSGAYGHWLGGAVGLGYVPCEAGTSAGELLAGDWEIDVGGARVAAAASLRPFYDPRAERMKA